jgi:hypothetical protein
MEVGLSSAASRGLRPLSVGETIDAAINLYRRYAVLLWQAVAVVVLPLAVIELIVRRASLPSGVFLHDGTLYTTNLNGATTGAVPSLVVIVIGALAQLLSIGAVFKLLLDGYLGRRPELGESFSYAAARLGSLVWLAILTGLLVVIGLILLVIPGIYLIGAFSVAIPVLMMEGRTGLDALGRSRELVRGRWWPTIARIVVAALLVGILEFVFGLIDLGSAFGISNVTLYYAVNALVSAVASIIAAPFTAAVVLVTYIDLRVRKEALDLELLAGGDGGTGGAGGTSDPWVAAGAAYQAPSSERRPPETIGGWPRTNESARSTPSGGTIGGWPRNQPSRYRDPPRSPEPSDRPADPEEGTSIPPPGG